MDISKLHLHWRISSYKGHSYKSYSLARAFRDDGKNRKEIIVKLGKLSDTEAQRWRGLLNALKNKDSIITNLNNLVAVLRYDYLDVAVVNAFWDYWRLDEVFEDTGKKELEVDKIARILTLNRCVEPESKSKVAEWFQSTALPWMLDIKSPPVNSSRIFRELSVIENHKESLCEHLFHLIRTYYPESMKSIMYDLSSSTFSGNRCMLTKWGHCKDGYQSHVVLALIVNKDGLPFYWDVMEGNTADGKTIEWLLQHLENRFKIANATIVFDRGMVSDDNLSLIEKSGIKYITAMDKNQIEKISDFDFTHLSNSENDPIQALRGFKMLNNITYYQEVEAEGNRRYILIFNPQLYNDQRAIRNQSMDKFLSFVDNLNRELLTARNARNRKTTYTKFRQMLVKLKLAGYVDVELKITHVTNISDKGNIRKVRTYQAVVKTDEDKKKIVSRLDGFWMLVTNHVEKMNFVFEMSAPEIIEPYREKSVIESAFRDIKSFVEIEPIYVWQDSHVKAHYTICVLSYLINRTISLCLHRIKENGEKSILTHQKLYDILATCKIDCIEVENVRQSIFNMTKPTEEQRKLLQQLNLSHLLDGKIVKKINSLNP